MLIEQGYNIWPGDIPWLLAQTIIICEHGFPMTEKQIMANQLMAKELLNTNTGGIIKE